MKSGMRGGMEEVGRRERADLEAQRPRSHTGRRRGRRLGEAVVSVLRVWMTGLGVKQAAGRRRHAYTHRQRTERRLGAALAGGGRTAGARRARRSRCGCTEGVTGAYWARGGRDGREQRARGGRMADTSPPGPGAPRADVAALSLRACRLGRALQSGGARPSPLSSNAVMTATRFRPRRPALHAPSVSTAAAAAGSKRRSEAPGSAASSRPLPPLPALPTSHPRECTTHWQLPRLGGEPLSA